jgi:hypothetical protein
MAIYRITTRDNGYAKEEADFVGTEREVRRHIQLMWENAVHRLCIEEDATIWREGEFYIGGFGFGVIARPIK